ncbi:FAD-dependent oxidoreductase [Brevibacterium jeotgali]|uniref:NADPH-dependent 2,4-dienoyl-CoA reductase, sulfur reductase n=1 Tax=Brevibacterium jeotgali TaxID=1262550 RepID=A0A2H1L6C6_9MICO|nr:FAD/NAD(P)-binding oxidoreductase [Brevibacterium jeotgali]TWB99047.1 NADPH-dependent 2,4-dienoyl-CoA reductase/sulfur reductase-like enzyme [Brevibacterium jeotgali]SMY12446.1 NADPH-dependent 2,4-dienoyl-CoA reductase, sulfur reductase [Brevibacterium jeotgali]
MDTDTRPLVVAGGGAAGRAAVQALLAADAGLPVLHLAGPAVEAIDRTMVDKAIMTGRLSPARAMAMRPPLTGATTREDCVIAVAEDPHGWSVRVPGEAVRAAGLVLATGSRPDRLDVPGADAWAAAGRLSTLHSVDDALRIRELLDGVDGARVLVTGSGLVGAEAASLLTAAGHRVTLVARSGLPGAAAWGPEIARRIARLHDETVDARWSARIVALEDGIAVLDDGTAVEADLVIVAHGARPRVPGGIPVFTDAAGASGGVRVDDRLRVHGASAPLVAAGAVAQHGVGDEPAAPYRIDHWDDAEAQGAHAAKALLHAVRRGEDPGPYRPRSPWSARIHGSQVAGFGHPVPGTTERVVSEEPLLVEFRAPDGTQEDPAVSAVVGLDAGRALRDHARGAGLR